ncbi:hypothetical protein KY289_013277 [Solanum tuberosum]|nr:hypothetical protein KY289_013277 [Solanum tuberosum]
MAHELPVSLSKPSDQSHQRRLEKTNKTHQESTSNSSYNSTNLSDKLIHPKLFRGNDSTTQGLQYTEKSSDSILPIERTDEAISGTFAEKSPEMRIQIRPPSHQFHGDLNTGVYSPGEEVHLTAISSRMDRPISGDKNFGKQATEKLQGEGGVARGTYSMDEEVHHANISINIDQEHNQEEIQASLVNLATIRQVEVEELNGRPEEEQQGTCSHDRAGPNGQKKDQHSMEQQKIETNSKHGDTRISQDLNDQLGNTHSTSLEEQQTINNNSESRNQNGDNTQAGQKNVVMNVQEQGRGDTEPHQQTDRNYCSVNNNSQTQLPDNGGNSEPNNYHKEFPKISSNFDRHTISNQKGH